MNEQSPSPPDDRLGGLKGLLAEKMDVAAGSLSAERFRTFADAVMRDVLLGAAIRAAGEEATIWLIDDAAQNLMSCLSVGPHASRLTEGFKQPLRSGMISLVFASELAICENEVSENPQHDKTLDTILEVSTEAMIAVPLHFAKRVRGVISVVRFKPPENQAGGKPMGFFPAALPAVQSIALVLSRVIEYRLLTAIVGWP